jgi:hypothetical protein
MPIVLDDGKGDGEDGGPEAAPAQDVSQPLPDTPAQAAQALSPSHTAADLPAAAPAATTPLAENANGTPAESGMDLHAEPVAQVEAEAAVAPADPPQLDADVQQEDPGQMDDATESIPAAAEPSGVADIAAAPADTAPEKEG